MNLEAKHILLFIALALLLTNRLLQKKPFFTKHGNLIRVLVFLILIAALVLEFLKSKSYMIFIVAALGVVAIGWIIYDMNRKDDDEESELK
jgi:FtsH-binding integral membrane protein